MGPIRNMLADVGITEQQWRVLRILEESGPLDPTRIAEQACLLLPSLTRILQKLDEKDLIGREVDPHDRRKQIVRITAQGERLIAENLDTSVQLMDEIREQIGEDRYEMLLDLLNELDDQGQEVEET